MLCIPKIDDYLKILADEEVKGFVRVNFTEYFKSIREKLYSKLNEELNLRKVAKSFYIFQTATDEVEKYVEIMQSNSSDNYIRGYNVEILNIFDPELNLINTKPMIKNKLKELFVKVDRKTFHSRAKLIASDSNIDKAFKSMHQSIMKKIKNYDCKDWVVLDVIIKQSIKIFEC